jgi:serine/threonine-protein kinase
MSIPSHFGRYRIVAHLATGGMAQVFIARLEGPGQFQRTVAVKRVLPHLVEDVRFREMFLDEARVSAAIHHPAVAEVYDLVSDEGEVYLVMEYVPGETVLRLARALRRTHRPLPWHLAAYVVAQASAGLHAAHTLRLGSVPQPVVHRDVSPHNILVGYDGSVKVIDFGIAKMRGQEGRTQAGEVKGKFAYMSPEQARSHELDPRTDVFSLGIVLWELLTGRRLFGREDEVATLQAVLHEDVVGPSVVVQEIPDELDVITLMALSREREERQESADELRRQLESVLAAHGTSDPREELRQLMQEEFAERAATKDLLVHGELPEGYVPSLATPSITEISIVSRDRTQPRDAPALPERRPAVASRWWIAAAITVAGLATWVGVAQPGVGDDDERIASEPAVTRAPPRMAGEPASSAAGAEPEPSAGEALPAVLDLTSTPIGAEAFLDGTFLGITPLSHREDEAREGTLLLRLAGHRSVEAPVALTTGETTRVALTLRRAPAPSRREPARGEAPAPGPAATATAPEARPDYFRFD